MRNQRRMKNSDLMAGMVLAVVLAAAPFSVRADDAGSTSSANAKPEPDLRMTCPVSGDKPVKWAILTCLCITARRPNFAARIAIGISPGTRPNI
jgi:hypothetical protein